MDQESVLKFFSKIHLIGTKYERANTVVDCLRLINGSGNYVCFIGSNWNATCCIKGDYLDFENNGEKFKVGKLESQSTNTENFKRDVILAIDSAEIRGGTTEQKRDRFKEIFSGSVNVCVYKATSSSVCAHANISHAETRGDTTYLAWIVKT